MPLLFYIPTILIFGLFCVALFCNPDFLRKYLIWIVVAAVLANGLIYIFVMPYFNAVDETAHFAYIAFLDEYGHLPLLSDYTDGKIINFQWHVDRNIFKVDPKTNGLAGMQYEAFQPPLYYLLALPFYKIAGASFVHKIYLLRFLGLIQLLILVYIAYKILGNIRNLFIRKKLLTLLAALIIIGFTPSIIVRAVTIGNSVLPIIFVSLIFWWMSGFFSNPEKRVSRKDAVAMGIFTALAILSRFAVLFVIPLVLLFFLIKKRNFIVNSLIYFFITILVISPWIYFNLKHYGTPTANKQAAVQQANFGFGNPGNIDIDLKYIQSSFPTFMKQIWVPEETNIAFLPPWHLNFFQFARYLNFLWIIGAATMLILSINNIIKEKDYRLFFIFLFLGMGVFGGILQIVAASLYGNWHAMIGRHLHPIIVFIAIFFSYILYFISGTKNKIIFSTLGIVLIFIPLTLNLEFIYQLNQSHSVFIELLQKKQAISSYLNTKIEGKGISTDGTFATTGSNNYNFSGSEYSAFSQNNSFIITTDNLSGISFHPNEGETDKLYYLFEGDSEFNDENSDTTNSNYVSLNIVQLEKVYQGRLMRLRIESSDINQKFDLANMKIIK